MAQRLLVLLLLLAAAAHAEPVAPPGDMRLRFDLERLNDSGVIDIPLTAWPLAYGDIYSALAGARREQLDDGLLDSWDRVRHRVGWELQTDTLRYDFSVSASENPRYVRSFEQTPREDGEAAVGVSWLDDRFTLNLRARYTANPFDDEEIRPDGTYVGAAIGNWIVTAGWQERWWGPGRDGSMILGTNARPTPGIAIQRIRSVPFRTKWLSWMGPWTLAGFLTELDDERTVRDAWLLGVRGSFRPPGTGLEIGLSRTAQWCGDNRPCDLGTFADLVLGMDNRGINVDFDNEPGNQLGGFDIRWTLPGQLPVAVYMQWIGEDGRDASFPTVPIGNWLRQLGVEYWGTVGSMTHRTHVEISEPMCRQGGFGLSGRRTDCAYSHDIYTTGYRYEGRSIGHGADGDSLSYSIGSTLVQSAGYVWNISLRHMEINRDGAPDPMHSLTPTPQDLTDLQISHERETPYGRFYAGFGYSRLEDDASGNSDSDISAFLQWSSR